MTEREQKNKLRKRLKKEAHKKHPFWRRVRGVFHQKPKTFLGTTIAAAFLGGFATNLDESIAKHLQNPHRDRPTANHVLKADEILTYFNIFASLYHQQPDFGGNKLIQMMNCPTCSNAVAMATAVPQTDIRLICNKCKVDYRQIQQQKALNILAKE